MTQDQKLDLLLEKFDVMSGQMGSIDNRLTTLEGRVDALDHKVTTIDKKVDKHYRELKSMDKAIFDEVERVHHILMRHQADNSIHTA